MPGLVKIPSLENQSRAATLRRLRIERGLSQTELAERCRPKSRQQTVGKLEKGYLWSFKWVKALAGALGVEPDVFAPFAALTDPREATLIELFRQLDDGAKTYALRALNGLAEPPGQDYDAGTPPRRRSRQP